MNSLSGGGLAAQVPYVVQDRRHSLHHRGPQDRTRGQDGRQAQGCKYTIPQIVGIFLSVYSLPIHRICNYKGKIKDTKSCCTMISITALAAGLEEGAIF
jgi:hypothetical protein